MAKGLLSAAQVNAEVDTALNTAVPLTPTANSLNDILSKADGANTFDNTTDSLEAIRDKIDTLPTAGAVVSTASATATGTIVEDTTTGTPKLTPVASSATANTFGNWAEHDASASADSWISCITVMATATIANDFTVELGTGAAASEVTKIRFSGKLMDDIEHVSWNYTLSIPIKVASGTRIALRASDNEAVAKTFYIGVQMYQGLET